MSEEQTNEEEVTTPEVNPDMEKALSDGWRPQEEWEGDPKQWVDYNEFNYRGQLMGRISEQSNIIHNQAGQLEELRLAINDLKELNKKTAEVEHKKIMKGLRARKAQAIEEGDGAAVAQIEEQIDELNEARTASQEAPAQQQPTQQQQQVHPEVQAWVTAPQNQWYNTNPVMRHTANAMAAELAAEHKDWSPGRVLAEVDKTMRREMPQKFPQSPVGGGDGGHRPSGGKSKTREFKDLNEDEQAVARRLVKQGVFENYDQYIEQLDAVGE